MEKPPPMDMLACFDFSKLSQDLTMTVVNHDIRFLILITNHPDTMKTRFLNLTPWNSRFEISMSQHTEPEERQCDTLWKEDLAYVGWNLCKSITDAANDKVLEGSGVLIESRLLFVGSKESFFDERIWQLDHCKNISVTVDHSLDFSIHTKEGQCSYDTRNCLYQTYSDE